MSKAPNHTTELYILFESDEVTERAYIPVSEIVETGTATDSTGEDMFQVGWTTSWNEVLEFLDNA